MLDKGLLSAADVLVVDLEDAIAPDGKEAARATTAAFLASHTGTSDRPRIYVRINDLESGLAQADLEAIVPHRPDGIMLPKPKSGDDVRALASTLQSLEAAHGVEPGTLAIFVLVLETPEAVLNIASFQDCGSRVTGFTWGAEDLAAAIGAKTNRDASGQYSAPFALARNLCLYAAAAAGVAAIDTVFTDFRNADGLERDAREAARDGFSGKLAIHPDQVAIINEAFTPTAEEVAHAQRIVDAFDAAPGAGAVGLDGMMVDRPHLVAATRTLERARLAAK